MPSAIMARWAEIRIGFMILTRFPMGRIDGEAPSMAASAWCWPLVGLVVGGLAAAVWWMAVSVGLPPLLAATLAILAGVLATGGLHEDGLADLFDGFGGGRDKARVLEIMRDSRIGSYGALALGFSLLVRAAALASLDPGTGVWALAGLTAASRAVMPMALRVMPPARPDGLGKAAGGVGRGTVLIAPLLGLAALLPLGVFPALAIAFGMAAASTALGLWAVSRIGGQTGDVLGAMCQLGEISGWLAVSALLSGA